MNKQQLHKDLVTEYDELNEKINALDAFINSLDFEEQVPDFIERELLRGKRHCMRNYRDNLKARIKCIECQIKKEDNDRKALDDWMDMKGQVVNTLCGPVRLINTDEQHHCGQDASCPVGGGCATVQDPNESQPADIHVSLKDLVGMQVVAVNDVPCSKCVCGAGHTPSGYPLPECVKIELVGGTYLCLAPTPNSIVTE